MKTKTEIREKKIIIFYTAETMEEVKEVSQICRSMKVPNQGYFNLSSCTYGWIKIPMKSRIPYSIDSGAKSK